ncbi:MAG: HisA/HisF-related TIM barrel protein [Methylococcus sp.]|nr:HisA/HisF-related TIM barrel protein [Methylococcus sp.]
MKIIPVLDLMQGTVVHAVKGHRETYRPVSSPLCPDADPYAVVEAFLRLHPFEIFYIADLDALMGGICQRKLIMEMQEAFPGVIFWVDQGLPDAADHTSIVPVVGSESLDTTERLRQTSSRDWILSLDFFDGFLKGPADILECPESWPDRVIVMSLNRVGGFDGPDLESLERVRRIAPGKRLIAAGGVRDGGDLAALESRGVHAVLVASALHSGDLGLERFGSPSP